MVSNNPLPSELREKICKVMGVFPEELKEYLPNTFGDSHMKGLLELFEQEYQRRIKAAKTESTCMDCMEADNYYDNLKQLSGGEK